MLDRGLAYFIRGLAAPLGSEGELANEPAEDAGGRLRIVREGDEAATEAAAPARRPIAPPTYAKAWLRRKLGARARHRTLPRWA